MSPGAYHGRMPAARRAIPALVALAVALLVVGSATAAGNEPVARHSAGDMKRARALVLGLTDLGRGWVSERKGTSAPGTDAAAALRCAGYDPDLSGVVETGSAAGGSFSFDDGSAFYSVGSAATVLETPEMTTLTWDRSIRPAIVSCFRSAFVRGLQLGASKGKQAAPKVRFGRTVVFRPKADTTRRVGFRLAASIVFPEKGSMPLPVVIAVVFLSEGRHLSFATIASLGDTPPPTLERAVTSRLAARIASRRPSA